MLDLIFCEIHPVTRSGLPATLESIFDNSSRGFRSWTRCEPPATRYCVSPILFREYGFEPLRECLLTILELLSRALPSSTKLLSGGATMNTKCIFDNLYGMINANDYDVR